MSNEYWRGMVKDAINCDDVYADILLEWASCNSNGIDTSEATKEALDKYWNYIHSEYQQEMKEDAK